MRESAPPPPPSRPWLRLALVWLVSLGLLAWLLHQVPLSTVAQTLTRAPAGIWALTIAALALSYLWRAARLQVVLGLDEQGTSAASGAPRKVLGLRLDALRVILMHNAAVNLLPMRSGELSFPWLASRHLGMPLDASVASLLWMRLQDLAVLLALGLLMWPGLWWAWRVAGLLAIAGGWWLGVALLKSMHTAVNEQAHAQSATAGWRRLLGKLHTALLAPHHHRWSAWALTWANWSTKLAAGACLLGALTQHPWRVGWAGALFGELAAVVPVQGPAGFGTYEAGVWAGFAIHAGQIGAQTGIFPTPTSAAALVPASVVPAALALHLCFLLCAVVAGLMAWATPSWSAQQTARHPD
jgi:Lysylphosphatidylglycerol synthase TM region